MERPEPDPWPPGLPDTVHDPEWAAIALIRLLASAGPREAEGHWSLSQAAQLRASEAGGDAWFEVRYPHGTRFIRIGRDSGCFQSEPPTEAERAGLPLVAIEPPPPAPLLAYLEMVVAQLPADHGLRLAFPDVRQTLADAKAYGVAFPPLERFRTDYLGTFGAFGAEGDRSALGRALKDTAARHFQQAIDDYANFRMVGPVAARLMLLTAILQKTDLPPPAVVSGIATAPPGAILQAVVDVMLASDGGRRAAIALADELAGEGSRHVAALQAEGATDDDAFAASLFMSWLPFNAAYILVNALAARADLDPATLRQATTRKGGYDEDTTLSLNALYIGACNAIDGRFVRAHRQRIREVRAERGDAGVESFWLDYSVRQRFYGRRWRPVILSEVDHIAGAREHPPAS